MTHFWPSAVNAQADPDMGDLVNGNTPKIEGGIGVGTYLWNGAR